MKKKFFTLFGLSFFVSVGYLDPGNWATDIAAGSEFGYKLIWVIVLANIIAIILQSLTIILVKYSDYDLAEICRIRYGKKTMYLLWILAQIAIIATDLAELLGSAIALNLLFKIPIAIGVLITVLDVFLILFLENKGFNKLQGIIIALVLTITGAFIIELCLAGFDLQQFTVGLVPTIPNYDALILVTGIIGATIMPHNLYMQAGLVKRNLQNFNLKTEIIQLIFALNLALIVNCSILILSAQVFHANGFTAVASIEQAYLLLAPLVGIKAAALLFGFALLLSGQASTITGTLSAQIVMEGFLQRKFDPKVLRIVTRLCAMIPTLILLYIFGDSEVNKLLILSQVILSLQLPFAIIPLIVAVTDQKFMQNYTISKLLLGVAGISALFIIILNLLLVAQTAYHIFNSLLIVIFILGLIIYFMKHLIFFKKITN
ncbi:MAG: Nramp family divalent metal transporter [Mycoplasmatales bacterium]